jgi:ABC-type Fe3+ transport system permease subunit
MTSGTWLHDHESLAAALFVILSLGLTGAFALLERRFVRKKQATAYPQQKSRFLKLILAIALRYSAIRRKIFTSPPTASDLSPRETPEAPSSAPVRPR